MRGKSHRDCVLTAVLQELMASSMWRIAPVRGVLLLCPGLAVASLGGLSPTTELQGFALQPPLLVAFQAIFWQGLWTQAGNCFN